MKKFLQAEGFGDSPEENTDNDNKCDFSEKMAIEELIPDDKIDYSKPRKLVKLDSPQPSDSMSQVSKISKQSADPSFVNKNKKPASKAWDHFEDHPTAKGRIRCKECPKDPINETTYAAGTSTSTLLKHYNKFHAPKEQHIITNYFPTQNSKSPDEKRNFCLKQLIIGDDLPFSLVESEVFRNYTSSLNADFKLPCRQTFSKKIEDLFNEFKENLISYLKTISSKISITVDGWTSPNFQPYIGITCKYFLICDIFIKKY
jgi:hypothetical protein